MRLKVIRGIYLAITILVVLRLGFWQIIKSDELTAKAESQRTTTREVIGNRGAILFADRSIMASTQPSFLAFAEPQIIKRESAKQDGSLNNYQKDFAEKIAPIFWENDLSVLRLTTDSASLTEEFQKSGLKKIENDIYEKINQNFYWVNLGRKVNFETKQKLDRLELVGLGFDNSSVRFYPEGSSSAHIMGFVGSDVYGNETGYFGLEGYYNGELKGKKGTLSEEKDALGLPILIGKFISKEPKFGKTLVTNIDRTIQHAVEESLKKGIEKYKAKGASAIVMDPKTGNVLAMASVPNYDPRRPHDFPSEHYKNPITVDSYEPGSTFKVLVMASGINEGLVKPDTICDICSGPLEISNYTIKTWNNKYMDNPTMADVIIHSDNTGMVFVGRKLGIEKMHSYLQQFGFGNTTNIDVQDEQSPELRPLKDWREIDLATSSFGQGISTTALQVVRAVAAIANGGKIMEPHIVKSVEDQGKVFNIVPRVIAEPLKPEATKQVTEMMVRAVDEGEAKFAKPKGYKIAGKTGTAQIPVAGHYDPNKTIASFVGFAPADDPKFVMLVRYDQPTTSIYGAETAAPTFFEIAKEILLYYGIPPTE